MPNFANVQLIGHLGQDPESSYIGETPVLRFSLAVNTGFKEKKTTSWYRCTMFGTRAKAVAPMLSKGKAVLVSGEPCINEYIGKDGHKRASIDVRISELVLISAKDSNQATFDDYADTVPF